MHERPEPLKPLTKKPIVIAHRGASADRPEHSLAAYRLAIAQGADFIEPDLVITKDGVLVARHENEIGSTTNVSDFSEFADRHTEKLIDGKKVRGWFTEDFTLAELQKLRARERISSLRPANNRFSDEKIPTLDEILELIAQESRNFQRPIGIYPETKHPSYFRALGLPLEEPLLKALARHHHSNPETPVFIQSFEVENLIWLRERTNLPLVQLLSAWGKPADRSGKTYRQMRSNQGLSEIARYANAIGPDKQLLIRPNLRLVSRLSAEAHSHGLQVHPWTFRPENKFLPYCYRSSLNSAARGNSEAEIMAFLKLGIDGLFSDSTEIAVQAVQEFMAEKN